MNRKEGWVVISGPIRGKEVDKSCKRLRLGGCEIRSCLKRSKEQQKGTQSGGISGDEILDIRGKWTGRSQR